jgi:hypothetical protein
MNYNKHVYNLIVSKIQDLNMIKLKNKIKCNHISFQIKKKIKIFFFRLRAEIKQLQNEIERNKPLMEHYKAQIDILEKRTPPVHGKINIIFNK